MLLSSFSLIYIKFYRHKKNNEKSKMRALSSQSGFCVFFRKDPLPFPILDIYKCPFSFLASTFIRNC